MNRPPPRSNRPVPLFPTRRSSDLLADGDAADRAGRDVTRLPCRELAVDRIGRGAGPELQIDEAVDAAPAAALLVPIGDAADRVQLQMAVAGNVLEHAGDAQLALFRSEEHTSELQSLMRISYAVFCLKKKKR